MSCCAKDTIRFVFSCFISSSSSSHIFPLITTILSNQYNLPTKTFFFFFIFHCQNIVMKSVGKIHIHRNSCDTKIKLKTTEKNKIQQANKAKRLNTIVWYLAMSLFFNSSIRFCRCRFFLFLLENVTLRSLSEFLDPTLQERLFAFIFCLLIFFHNILLTVRRLKVITERCVLLFNGKSAPWISNKDGHQKDFMRLFIILVFQSV